jgi:LysM repeat protein
MRKFFLLILFLAFIALLFSLFRAEQAGVTFGPGLSAQASPSGKPLPQAWSGAERARVRLAGDASASTAAPAEAQTSSTSSSSTCPAIVSVQAGDTLGVIAKRCGISLAELLAANPTISNPNRIYSGQQIVIHGERGGGAAEVVTAQPAAGFAPGAAVVVEAGGFAPGAQVKIGIGLPGAGFKALGAYAAGADGLLSVPLTIPAAARSGERAFFLLTSSGSPTVTVISEGFIIGD